MATALTVHVNTTAVDSDRIAQPGNYEQVDLANDKFIFSAGGTGVTDGDDTPTGSELNAAATIIQPTDVEIDKLFLLDFSDAGQELKEIDLAGSTDTQFVINFSFDGATASEPSFEGFDDNSHSSTNANVLGAGTPADSMVKAILTTTGSPGAAWTGTTIAGALAPNILLLNAGGGALGGATEIYINIQIIVPGNFATPFVEAPVLTIRFTFS